MKNIFFLKKSKKAQLATELAIFGAILVFAVGAIVRSGMNSIYIQNQQLKSMRTALSISYKSSEAVETGRNTATVLIVEDRLTIGSGPFGSTDRTPYIFQGSGTHTKNFFYPVEWMEGGDVHLPKFDLIVNGQHFHFTLAGWAQIPDPRAGGINPTAREGFLRYPLDDSTLADGFNPAIVYDGKDHPDWQDDCAYVGRICARSPDEADPAVCRQLIPPEWVDPGYDLVDPGPCGAPGQPLDPLTGLYYAERNPVGGADPKLFPGCFTPETIPEIIHTPPTAPGVSNPTPGNILLAATTKKVGCRQFYKQAGNYEGSSFCVTDTDNVVCNCPDGDPTCAGSVCVPIDPLVPNPATDTVDCEGCHNPDYKHYADIKCRIALTQAERFDLDRDGPLPPVPPELWESFGWQWDLIIGVTRNKFVYAIRGELLDDTEEEPGDDDDEDDEEEPLNMQFDVDRDFKEEVIKKYDENEDSVVTALYYLDYQEGDLDFSKGDADPGPFSGDNPDPDFQVGFLSETQFFGRTSDGTLQELKEEGLQEGFSGQHTYQQTRKKSRVDIIQRVFQLSKNTGRFCQGGLNPGIERDLESCATPEADCFHPAKIATTCFDESTLRLYIRSRIQDLHGRIWTTPITCECPNQPL